jgi:hypothetical protein
VRRRAVVLLLGAFGMPACVYPPPRPPAPEAPIASLVVAIAEILCSGLGNPCAVSVGPAIEESRSRPATRPPVVKAQLERRLTPHVAGRR